MLGLQTKLNGTTVTVMVAGITHAEPPLMFVQMFQGPLLVQQRVVTVGVVTIQMVMDGLTKEINSYTNHHSGVMKTAMDSEIIQMAMKETHVQMNVANHSSTD